MALSRKFVVDGPVGRSYLWSEWPSPGNSWTPHWSEGVKMRRLQRRREELELLQLFSRGNHEERIGISLKKNTQSRRCNNLRRCNSWDKRFRIFEIFSCVTHTRFPYSHNSIRDVWKFTTFRTVLQPACEQLVCRVGSFLVYNWTV